MVSAPTGAAADVHDPPPLLKVTMQSGVRPLTKLTVPVGVAAPDVTVVV